MSWNLSEFGQRLGRGSGIGNLMDDLGHALAAGGDRVCMLGGGQPAHIPQIDAVWRRRIEEISAVPGQLEHALGNYEPPAGNMAFRTALAKLFQRQFGWSIGPENVAVTPGGQTAFFLLFNTMAGRFPDGTTKKILLPIIPEYIGYANQSVAEEMFVAVRPKIERIGQHRFKYRVDFESLEITDDIAAICVSRPTNPSGNVLTDAEIAQLAELASQNGIPLIVDGAYGAPFPGAIFTETTPVWNDNIVLTLSLSKVGLPGTRTGIVIGNEDLIRSVASMTSIVGLANTNMGQAIVTPLIESGELLQLSDEVIKPFYQQKSIEALRIAEEVFDDSLPYRIHQSEGAFFLWLWFEDLPITSAELYERLKARDVLVVPGHHFFFGDVIEGVSTPWKHHEECIRMTFTMPEPKVRQGLSIIADEVRRAHQQG
ncbi:Valine--pyruvate aminotransferase [Rubripirellula tenax]|uniref:Valine--pyruvate aminotransferase n=1 Tax=Rubripirellula tenax TaxID=2528015 RepID=A0A5C6EMF4_9BACT|nr:valine--pyruvate transaminase [Rubripirellula tenax]TWU50933.1 Valine--pyruvate aminotransferase [Rubripirellula tenax]